jgi:small-conductance mechanosensitive channel
MTQLIDQNIVHTVSELIKLSVAPVFLLAAVAGLLNVFIGRLTRIMDKLDRLVLNENMSEKLLSRRKFLTMRLSNINLAIFFCTTTGLLVALVILTMFLSTLFNFSTSLVISVLFILAMVSLIIALCVFLKEIHYTTSFIKTQREISKIK